MKAWLKVQQASTFSSFGEAETIFNKDMEVLGGDAFLTVVQSKLNEFSTRLKETLGSSRTLLQRLSTEGIDITDATVKKELEDMTNEKHAKSCMKLWKSVAGFPRRRLGSETGVPCTLR